MLATLHVWLCTSWVERASVKFLNVTCNSDEVVEGDSLLQHFSLVDNGRFNLEMHSCTEHVRTLFEYYQKHEGLTSISEFRSCEKKPFCKSLLHIYMKCVNNNYMINQD